MKNMNWFKDTIKHELTEVCSVTYDFNDVTSKNREKMMELSNKLSDVANEYGVWLTGNIIFKSQEKYKDTK